MEQRGKITFKQLEESDYPKLEIFLDTCRTLGYENNSSFESIKLDKMKLPYGQFFIGIIDDKIVTFAGVHHMDNNRYRCMFRGASLPGYTTGLTGLRASYQVMYLLNMQIDLILEHNKQAEFYVTSNIEQLKGKSSRMNSVWLPRASKIGIFTLVDENFEYNYTKQRLWRLNVDKYKSWRLNDDFLFD